MKLNATLAASLFALMAAIPLNAAADAPADTHVDKATTPATSEKATTQKKAKPHSHMEEKTGVAQKAPEALPDKPKAARHYHPRDGK